MNNFTYENTHYQAILKIYTSAKRKKHSMQSQDIKRILELITYMCYAEIIKKPKITEQMIISSESQPLVNSTRLSIVFFSRLKADVENNAYYVKVKEICSKADGKYIFTKKGSKIFNSCLTYIYKAYVYKSKLLPEHSKKLMLSSNMEGIQDIKQNIHYKQLCEMLETIRCICKRRVSILNASLVIGCIFNIGFSKLCNDPSMSCEDINRCKSGHEFTKRIKANNYYKNLFRMIIADYYAMMTYRIVFVEKLDALVKNMYRSFRDGGGVGVGVGVDADDGIDDVDDVDDDVLTKDDDVVTKDDDVKIVQIHHQNNKKRRAVYDLSADDETFEITDVNAQCLMEARDENRSIKEINENYAKEINTLKNRIALRVPTQSPSNTIVLEKIQRINQRCAKIRRIILDNISDEKFFESIKNLP